MPIMSIIQVPPVDEVGFTCQICVSSKFEFKIAIHTREYMIEYSVKIPKSINLIPF